MYLAILAGWLLLSLIAVAAFCRAARAARRTANPTGTPETTGLCEYVRGHPGRCTMLRVNRCRALC